MAKNKNRKNEIDLDNLSFDIISDPAFFIPKMIDDNNNCYKYYQKLLEKPSNKRKINLTDEKEFDLTETEIHNLIEGCEDLKQMLNNFEKEKIILNINNEEINNLVKEKNIENISIKDIFKHLPYKNFFIKNKYKNPLIFSKDNKKPSYILGIMITEKDNDLTKIQEKIDPLIKKANISLIIVNSSNLIKSVGFDLNILSNTSLHLLFNLQTFYFNESDFITDEFKNLFHDELISLLKNLYYLNAVNADILKEEYKPKVIKIGSVTKVINKDQNYYKVAYKSKFSIEKHKDKSDKVYKYIEGNGTPKRPHIRREHPHHYWIKNKITGEKELIVKIIPETLIKCNDNSDLVIMTKNVK